MLCVEFPQVQYIHLSDIVPGGVLKEFLVGDVPLGPWNPQPIPELIQGNFATLY